MFSFLLSTTNNLVFLHILKRRINYIMANFVEKIFGKVFGNKHEKDIKIIRPIVDEINSEFDKLKSISNDALRNKTVEFRTEINAYTKEIDDRISSIKTNIDENPEMDVEQKETLYD